MLQQVLTQQQNHIMEINMNISGLVLLHSVLFLPQFTLLEFIFTARLKIKQSKIHSPLQCFALWDSSFQRMLMTHSLKLTRKLHIQRVIHITVKLSRDVTLQMLSENMIQASTEQKKPLIVL